MVVFTYMQYTSYQLVDSLQVAVRACASPVPMDGKKLVKFRSRVTGRQQHLRGRAKIVYSAVAVPPPPFSYVPAEATSDCHEKCD